MVGRFTAKRAAATEFVPVEEPSPALEGMSWTVFPEPATEPILPTASANPLLTDKLLDAKVRLHRRLIEEINLQALERLPEDQIRVHIQQLVTQYILVERLALNQQELNDFVSEILDEMTGLGPIEPLLKDDTITDILINTPRAASLWSAPACSEPRRPLQGRGASAAHRQQDRLGGRAAGRRIALRWSTRGCRTARASTSRCGPSRSTGRWSRSANSPRSPSRWNGWSSSARSGRR